MNRKEFYSSSDRTNTQYKITVIPIDKDLPKESQKFEVNPATYLSKITEINFSKKISQKKANEFLCSNIFNISLMKNKTASLKKDNVKQTDFLFLDFEEPKQKSDKQVLSFDKCIEILKKNQLNYILKTSFNHTSENPRLHLFLPLLKPIKNDDEYKYNLQIIQEKYFSDYEFDISTKNINRFCFSSNSSSLQYAFNFEDSDISPESLDKRVLEISEQESLKPVKTQVEDIHLKNFNLQVQTMHNFEFARVDNNSIVKYYRNEKDKTPNIFYSASSYYDNCNEYTLYDKKQQFNVLFSYDDFANSINPQIERDKIQSKLSNEIQNWLIDGGKKYIVTNEGLGKSSTILKFGEKHNFLFVCYTRDRIDEVSSYLTQNKIKHKKVLSNYQILYAFELYDLAELYNEKVSNDDDLSFKKFINNSHINDELKDSIINAYEKNLEVMRTDNCVRLVTSAKLKVELMRNNFNGRDAENHFKEQNIIFDEFVFSEWSKFRVPKDGEEIEQKKTIWQTKNNESKLVNLAKNESFFDELKYSKRVLLLTTERSLIKPLFYNSEYKEIQIYEKKVNANFSMNEYKFERKLYDDSVVYILVKSTSVKVRDELIKRCKERFSILSDEDISVISDNAKERDYSHIAVKGSNEYSDKNLLIIATLRAEIEDNIFFYSCPEFFKKYAHHMKDLNLNPKKEVQNYIRQAHLLTQVSQSIGRNSGFRNRDKKTIVVLPLLTANSKYNFKTIDLNYISPNVYIQRLNM